VVFLKALKKGRWAVYVYSLPEGRYMIEYSDDGFGSKERREYGSKDELLEVLGRRFRRNDLNDIIT